MFLVKNHTLSAEKQQNCRTANRVDKEKRKRALATLSCIQWWSGWKAVSANSDRFLPAPNRESCFKASK